MKHKCLTAGACYATAVLMFAISPRSLAQTAPSAQPNAEATPKLKDDDVLVLSPFEVDSGKDQGSYRSDSTLAGTRTRTDLNDVASSISVVTAQFLQDTGVKRQQDLLVYTTNTEVGGTGGNFGGMGNTQGLSELGKLLRPSANNRVRGLDSADNTRDYFLTNIPWDSFNVGRLDLQRGPNSILFGVGSPAGVINANINTASLKEGYKAENRVGSFGSVRNSLDFNHVLLDQELAIKVAALDDETKFQQEPAYNHDKRIFGALRWDPKLFNSGSAHTSIRLNYERGIVKSNNPRTLPPIDAITPYFAANAINKKTFDPFEAQAGATGAWATNPNSPSSYWNPWIGNNMANMGNYDPVFWYENGSGSPFRVAQANVFNPPFGIGPSGSIDGNINGLPFSRPIAINGFNQFTKYANIINPSQYPAASQGIYQDRTLSDPSIFDFYNHLIDGPNKNEWQNWTAYNLDFSQTFFNNRLGFDVAYDYQAYNDGQEQNLGVTPSLSVDINSILFQYPAAYGIPPAVPNTNIGRAYVGNSAQYGNGANYTVRKDLRLTGTGELRADDFLGKSTLSKILGHHVFTGLYSSDDLTTDSRTFMRYGTGIDWTQAQGQAIGLPNAGRQVNWIDYLSSSLSGLSSAAGAHIQPVTAIQSPQGVSEVLTYNTHWKYSLNPADPSYVNPAAAWTNVFWPAGSPNSVSTQSENPANYIGWQNQPVNILNADKGDINQLYTSGGKTRNVITSESFVWQGFLLDDTIVPTFGWRRDTVRTTSANAPTDPITQVASMNYDIDGNNPTVSRGDSRSWGVVLHLPPSLRGKLPLGTDVSLTYNHGQNFRAENRVDFTGNPLPNANGTTKEYGVVITTLNDRLRFKVTKYDTQVSNANLTGALGSQAGQVYAMPEWTTLSALGAYAYVHGQASGLEGTYNYALADNGFDSSYIDPNGAQFKNAPSTAKEIAAYTDWFAKMPNQSFWNAYGFPINTAKAQSSDPSVVAAAVAGWTPYSGTGALVPSGAGKINGLTPTGTIDEESKGYEFEVTVSPTKNWNLTLNASKTTAERTALGQQLVTLIENLNTIYAGPAGDLRLWWAGDNNMRYYFKNGLWSQYQFQLTANGQAAAEIRPWRFNLVTNYTFDHGFLNKVNVGLGYRWQDGQILGYGLMDDLSGLDVHKPIWGKTETDVDGWIGYERMVTSKVNWRIQLNVRNIGEKAHLIPISAEPDGSTAAARIADGMTWTLTNTFSF